MKSPAFFLCLAACGSTTPAPAAPIASPVPSIAIEEPVPEPVPEPAPEPPPEPPPAPAVSDVVGDLPEGTTFTIVALSPEDAYFDDAARIVNLSCTATSPVDEASPGMYSGSVKCSDNNDYYFYKVAIASIVRP